MMIFKRKYLIAILLAGVVELGLHNPIAMDCAFAVDPDANIIDALDKSGRVKRDQLNRVIAVDLRKLPINLAILKSLAAFKCLRSLQLSSINLSANDLSVIAGLSSLQSLDLRGCEFDPSVLKSLQDLKELKVLRLSGKGVATRLSLEDVSELAEIESLRALLLDFFPLTDQAMKNITQHPQLRELGLAGTQITDRTVPDLVSMPRLKKLRLANTQITGEGLKSLVADSQIVDLDISSCQKFDERYLSHLNQIRRLSRLNLYDCPITDQGVRYLERLSELKWLNLDKTMITDQALSSVAKLLQLEFLHLGSTRITSEGLPRLSGLKRLNQLVVTETPVTDAQAKAFARENPSIKLQFGPKKP